MNYLPLRFIESSPNHGNEFTATVGELLKLGIKSMNGITREQYIDFLLSNNFLNPLYNGPYRDFNNHLIKNSGSLLEFLHVKENEVELKNEWRDIFLQPILWDKWAENKQVYAPDKDFADALLHTSDFQLNRFQLSHLPCNQFYIDVSNCEQFEPIKGILVNINVHEINCTFTQYLITDDLISFSFYSNALYDYEGNLKFDKKLMEELESEDNGYLVAGTFENLAEGSVSKTKISLFTLQLLAYISSKEPDIEENPITKKTYRKTSTVKNKFSEIQKHDIGIRYGKTIRTKISAAKKEYAKIHYPSDDDNEKHRKSTTPHFRCAHWQRFWIGQGRKECVNKWIEPVFVGFGGGDTDVVIHKVK